MLHYIAGKGAVVGLTRSPVRELGRFGIRVNASGPSDERPGRFPGILRLGRERFSAFGRTRMGAAAFELR